MAVPQEVPDQPAVLAHLRGPLPVRDAGRLNDRGVGGLPHGYEAGHRIDERDEAVIKHLDFDALSAGHHVAQSSVGHGALRASLGPELGLDDGVGG